MADRRGSIATGVAWMFLISVLLFGLPVFGPLIAGFVGGKKSGGLGAALVAVFAPTLVIAVLLFGVATYLTGERTFSTFLGIGGLLLILAEVGPLLVGAIIGGAVP